MEIILHVGAHRSATTTLQRMLGQNGPALNAAGIGYWGPKRTRGGLFQGLIGQGDAVLPWQIDRAEKRIRAQIGKEADLGRQMLVVSEENIIGSLRETLDDARLYPAAGARVERFARGMSAHRLTIALGIRSYEAWWTSALAFRLTRGGPIPRAGYCARLAAQPRRWRHVIADIAQALPQARIRVWCYEHLAGRPDAVAMALTGQTLGLSGAGAHLNPRDSVGRMQNYLADVGLSPALIRTEGGQFRPFDQDQRAYLRAEYAQDLAWLDAGAGGLATMLQTPGHKIAGLTGQGRGRSDDRDNRRLA